MGRSRAVATASPVAGGTLLPRILKGFEEFRTLGLVDDDPRKKNLRLHGVRVLGTIDDLQRLLHDRRPDEVLIAIPSASGELRELVRI